MSRFVWLVQYVEKTLRDYDAKDAALEIERFVSDLSTWFIRRSRDRVWVNSDDEEDKQNFYQTLHYILSDLSIILSPFFPFISEEIFTNLTENESVHLSSWPEVDISLYDKKLEEEMAAARIIVESGHAYRKANNLKVRVPLAKIELTLDNDYAYLRDEVWDVLLKELNIKNILINKKVKYPINEIIISQEELQKEGELRGLIRSIQAKRKELKLKPTDMINVIIPETYKNNIESIKKRILANKISIGKELVVETI